MSCKIDDIMDRHHLVPRYMGGSNDYTNIVKVSRTCHAMFHYCNWRLWGNNEDLLAYKGLSSQISKQEVMRQKGILAGNRSRDSKTGFFSLTEEERKAASSRGGKKAGKYMASSMWINNGAINRRIPRNEEVPIGWEKGRFKTKSRRPRKTIVNEKSKTLDKYLGQRSKRLIYLAKVDLEEWGVRTRIARDWGVSRTQVNRFIKKYYLI